MPSFRTTVSPSRRAASRFVTDVRRSIQRALESEKKKGGVTQSQIARAIDVHRSVINREVRGFNDIGLSRIGEIAWALGKEPKFTLVDRTDKPGQSASSVHGVTPERASSTPTPRDVDNINKLLSERKLVNVD